MKLKVGGLYETRDTENVVEITGRGALWYARVRRGWLRDGDVTWFGDGQVYVSRQHDLDLVREICP